MDSDRNIATSFSFLIPFRNREIERVENCLKSIATQTYKNFEVIFIDYGSDLEIAQKTREVVSRFGYNYLYSDTRYMFWNQNHALNIGLNVAKNEYIIRLDVDIILPPNFLDKISNSINDIQFINCQCYYTDQNFDYVNISKDKLAKLSISDFSATGLCMIVAKKYLLKINGFNEFYILWGFDDLDTTRSLQNLGLQLVWMDAIKVPLLHQWHKKNTSTLSELIYETKKKYYLNGTNLGSSHIGLKITTEERDCLKIIPLLDERKKITVSGYLESFRFEWMTKFIALEQGDYIYLTYSDSYESDLKSKLGFLIDWSNKLLKKLSLSYRLVSLEQFNNSFSCSQLDDFMVLFMMNFRHLIKDYYYKKDGLETTFIVFRK